MGSRPLGLEVGPGRPVEDAPLQLAPAALEGDPRELLASLSGIAGDRPHLRTYVDVRPARVVAADAFGRGAAEVQRPVVEVRVRAGSGMHHRMSPADDLELVVAPVRPLRALVLAVPDLYRPPLERLGSARGIEDELDHLPVALVRVVPVVERVVEPVLERELPRPAPLRGHVRVDRRQRCLGQTARPALVVAPRVERIAREVEVVFEAVRRQVGRRRCDLHEVPAAPWPTERHSGLVEQDIDVERRVRLPVAALLRLLDEPDDRRVALGERRLVGEVGGGGGGQAEGRHRADGEHKAHAQILSAFGAPCTLAACGAGCRPGCSPSHSRSG